MRSNTGKIESLKVIKDTSKQRSFTLNQLFRKKFMLCGCLQIRSDTLITATVYQLKHHSRDLKSIAYMLRAVSGFLIQTFKVIMLITAYMKFINICEILPRTLISPIKLQQMIFEKYFSSISVILSE